MVGQLDAFAAVIRHIAAILETHEASVVETDEYAVARHPAGISVGRGARPAAVVGADHDPRSVMEQQIAEQQAADQEGYERVVDRSSGDVLLDLVDGFDASWTRAIG